MTMCPYKWALYLASALAILWVTVEALLRFGPVANARGSGRGGGKAAATAATPPASDTDDEDDAAGAGGLGGGPLDDSDADVDDAVPSRRGGGPRPAGATPVTVRRAAVRRRR